MLTETLQDRADLGSRIDPAPLMRAAVVGGRRIRTRRRVTVTVLAAVTAGAIVAAGIFALPFTVGHPPTGAKLVTCSVRLGTQSTSFFEDGKLVYGDGAKTFTYYAADAHGGGRYDRPLKAGPNHVYADPRGDSWTMLMDDVFFDVSAGPKHAYTLQQALRTLGTVRMRPHWQDLSAW